MRPRCSASKAPAGTWRRSSRRACPRSGSSLEEAARARRALRRGHGAPAAREPDRSGGAEPVGRDAAARLPAAQVRRSHALDRGAEPHRPAGRRRAVRRGLRQAHGHRALHHAGLRAGESRGGSVRARHIGRRADPAPARHLHLRRGRARSLRAHDRDGDARRRSPEARPQGGVRRARNCRSRRPRSPTSRRSCAAPAA